MWVHRKTGNVSDVTDTTQRALEEVLTRYPSALSEPFGGHPVARLLTVDARNAVAAINPHGGYDIVGSPGKGRWAETPWVAVFDPLVTTSAQRGFYIVYLFREDGEAVYLSLNQGTTEVQKRVGGRYREVLEHQARLRRDLLTGDLTGTLAGPIDLSGRGSLTRGYEAGNIVALRYPRGAVPIDEVLTKDLSRFIELYAQLVSQSDALAEAAQASDGVAEPLEATEGDRFRYHKRVERNRQLAVQAKKSHGTTCQVCGFRFEDLYGELGAGYIEAHHLIPIAELSQRPRALNPATDFAVVCANCHRMLHTQRGRVLALDELRAIVELQRQGRRNSFC